MQTYSPVETTKLRDNHAIVQEFARVVALNPDDLQRLASKQIHGDRNSYGTPAMSVQREI